MELNISRQETLFIKGIAILFVILSHMGLFDCGGVIGVHLFLIVSGYGICCSYENNGKTSYWKRRISSVYMPYLFSTLILLIVRLIIYKYNDFSWKKLLITLAGLDFDLNIDPTMWYISYIFACYFIACGIFLIESDKSKTWIALIFGIMCFFIITACGYKHIIWHQGTNVWAYGLSFPFGMFMAKARKEKGKLLSAIKNLLVIASGGGVLFLLNKQHDSWIKFLFTLSSAILIMVICGWIFNCKEEMIKYIRPILYLGKNSYFMYLNEAFIIGCMPSRQNNKILITVFVIIISYILSVLFDKIYKKIYIQGEKQL